MGFMPQPKCTVSAKTTTSTMITANVQSIAARHGRCSHRSMNQSTKTRIISAPSISHHHGRSCSSFLNQSARRCRSTMSKSRCSGRLPRAMVTPPHLMKSRARHSKNISNDNRPSPRFTSAPPIARPPPWLSISQSRTLAAVRTEGYRRRHGNRGPPPAPGAAADRTGLPRRPGADKHRQAFMAFVAGLLGDFDRYLARGDIDPLRDGASYRMAGMWLDDAEFAEMLRDLVRVLQPRLANPPAPGRKRRILGTILLPGEEAAP